MLVKNMLNYCVSADIEEAYKVNSHSDVLNSIRLGRESEEGGSTVDISNQSKPDTE